MSAAAGTMNDFAPTLGDGSLTGMFNSLAIGALKLATIGLAAAVAWQMFLDPLFFLPIHDPTNVTAQAWMMFVNDYFSWIPRTVGLSKEPGLLSGPMDSLLASRKKLFEQATTSEVGSVLGDGGFSFDALGAMPLPF